MPLARIDLAEGNPANYRRTIGEEDTDSATVRCSNRRRGYRIVRFVQMESR